MPVEVSPLLVMTKDGRHVAGHIRGRVFRKQLYMRNMLNSPVGWSLDGEFLLNGKYERRRHLDGKPTTR